jgi:putative methyltransferase
MKFKNARKITYSTCSIHFEENEGVVFQALASSVAREGGWRILNKEQQVDGLKTWRSRGIWEDEKLDVDTDVTEKQKKDVLDACIRCDKGTEDGTMGFFVAAFVRDQGSAPNGLHNGHDVASDVAQEGPGEEEEEEEWNGFSEEEAAPAPPSPIAPPKKRAKSEPKKRNRHVRKAA